MVQPHVKSITNPFCADWKDMHSIQCVELMQKRQKARKKEKNKFVSLKSVKR